MTDRHPSSVPLLVFAYLTLFSAPFSVTPEPQEAHPTAGLRDVVHQRARTWVETTKPGRGALAAEMDALKQLVQR